MAAGDVFVNMYTLMGTGNFDIQPAAGVTVMITFMGTNNAGGSSASYLGRNATGSGVSGWIDPNISGNSLKTFTNGKIFINNTQYIRVDGDNVNNYVSYSGMEI